jgi:GWxTD domain-containing protein
MMDRINRKLFALLLLSVLAPARCTWAQPPLPQIESFPFASWILGSSKDSVIISFGYAIPYRRLIFTKSQDISEGTARQEILGANLSFSVDANDSATEINYHRFNPNKIVVKDFAVTQDPEHFAEGIITMTLPKSVYKVSAEVRDDNQQITYLNRTETKRLTDSVSALSVIFADSTTRNNIFPIFMNDVSFFPNPITFAILVPDSVNLNISLKLETVAGAIIKSDSMSPQKATLVPVDTNGSSLFRVTPCINRSIYLAKFEIDSLDEGEYDIEVDLNGKIDKIHFHYLWADKPSSLKNFKTALALLKYVVPDSVFSYLNSGSDSEKKEKFDRYWKSHDPTPKTAYNELEAEYYERADYAFDHFRTVSADDGDATDRGKAYILFGRPADVRREFRSDGTYEIWYYPNHKKDLIFKEQGPGNFILYRTEDL